LCASVEVEAAGVGIRLLLVSPWLVVVVAVARHVLMFGMTPTTSAARSPIRSGLAARLGPLALALAQPAAVAAEIPVLVEMYLRQFNTPTAAAVAAVQFRARSLQPAAALVF
jgi:hypothetical protein